MNGTLPRRINISLTLRAVTQYRVIFRNPLEPLNGREREPSGPGPLQGARPDVSKSIISFGVLSHVRLLGISLHVKLPVISLFILHTTYFALVHL